MVLKSDFCDLGFAKVDIDRQRRRGHAEVIFCPGKTNAHLKKIAQELINNKQDLLLTRLEKATFTYLKRSIPQLRYNSLARLGFLLEKPNKLKKGLVMVICAGTSDIPVAEEASVTLGLMGNRVKKLYDVGVAGVHRVMSSIDTLKKAGVI